MSYVPGFGNLLWLLGVLGSSAGFLYGIQFVDGDWKRCDRERLWTVWTFAGILSCMGLLSLAEQESPLAKVCLMALAIYLTVCTVMDNILCEVNDVVQYLGVLGGAVYVLQRNPQPQVGVSLILFAGLQHFLFLRYYGGADGMAFLICALYLAGMGKEADCFLFHMTLSYILLAIVQGIAGNISKKGKLITPVAMLPYICGSFLLMLL